MFNSLRIKFAAYFEKLPYRNLVETTSLNTYSLKNMEIITKETLHSEYISPAKSHDLYYIDRNIHFFAKRNCSVLHYIKVSKLLSLTIYFLSFNHLVFRKFERKIFKEIFDRHRIACEYVGDWNWVDDILKKISDHFT